MKLAPEREERRPLRLNSALDIRQALRGVLHEALAEVFPRTRILALQLNAVRPFSYPLEHGGETFLFIAPRIRFRHALLLCAIVEARAAAGADRRERDCHARVR